MKQYLKLTLPIILLLVILIFIITQTAPPQSFAQAKLLDLLPFFLPFTLLFSFIFILILKNALKGFLLSLILDLILILNAQSKLTPISIGVVAIFVLIILIYPKNFNLKSRRARDIPSIHKTHRLH